MSPCTVNHLHFSPPRQGQPHSEDLAWKGRLTWDSAFLPCLPCCHCAPAPPPQKGPDFSPRNRAVLWASLQRSPCGRLGPSRCLKAHSTTWLHSSTLCLGAPLSCLRQPGLPAPCPPLALTNLPFYSCHLGSQMAQLDTALRSGPTVGPCPRTPWQKEYTPCSRFPYPWILG